MCSASWGGGIVRSLQFGQGVPRGSCFEMVGYVGGDGYGYGGGGSVVRFGVWV
jgi:hypothetical protein